MPRAANNRRRGVVAALALLVIGLPLAWSQSGPSPSISPSSGEERSDSPIPVGMPPDEASHLGLEMDLSSGSFILPGPTTTEWRPVLGPGSPRAQRPEPPGTYPDRLQTVAYEVDVIDTHERNIGLLQRGSVVAARRTDAISCSDGEPYELVGGGFACTGDDLVALPAHDGEAADGAGDDGDTHAGDADPDSGDAPSAPIPVFDATRANPFRFARVIAERAPRLSRPPASVEEAAELDADVAAGHSNDLVSRWLVGDYFMAFGQHPIDVGEWTFYRTSAGNYVRARDLEARPLQPMHGEQLGGTYRLPLAFVFRDTDLMCEQSGALAACGRAEKHARFNVADPATTVQGGVTYVRSLHGIAVAATDARVVRKIPPPEGVPAGAKWVHIDLANQALVAYEGSRPVYATLVSSGRQGYETPNGLFRVERKFLSKTMRGKDIDNGRYYEVQEVPWTMYYNRNFAVHGAYWHDLFGMTKSHGCTNVPPVDARWLYYWADDVDVPPGWHAVLHQQGTWFYFSGESPPDGQ